MRRHAHEPWQTPRGPTVLLLRAPTATESMECAAVSHASAAMRASPLSPYDRPCTPAMAAQGRAVAAETEDAGPRGLSGSLHPAVGWRRLRHTLAQEMGGEASRASESLRRDARMWPGAYLLQRYLYGDGAARLAALTALRAMRPSSGDDPTRLGAFLATSEVALAAGWITAPLRDGRGELMRRLVGWPAVRGGLGERLRLLASETHPDRDLALRVVDARIPYQAERRVIQRLCVHLLKISRDPSQFELPPHPGVGRACGLELVERMTAGWETGLLASAGSADQGHVVGIPLAPAVGPLANLDACLRDGAPLTLRQLKDLRRRGEACCAALPQGYGSEARRWREAIEERLRQVAGAECAALCAGLGAGRPARDAAALWLAAHADISDLMALEWARAHALLGYHNEKERP